MSVAKHAQIKDQIANAVSKITELQKRRNEEHKDLS